MEGLPLLPGYTVGRRLGSDDSNLWYATEDATGRPVTLRVIDAPTPAVRDRLHSGISLMSAIDHLHVLSMEQAVDLPDSVVVIGGAADGGSLGDIIGTRGTLPIGEVITACAPVADALSEIHPHGIMHGNITVDEIVFTLDGRPMIAGVGLTQLGVAPSSTPLAPEVLGGSPASPSSDIYSLAAVAVVAMTGRPPQQPLSLPGVPPAALAVLARALDGAPQRRPDATMLSNALYASGSPEPVEIIASTESTGRLPRVESAPTFDDDDEAQDRVTRFMRQVDGNDDESAEPAAPAGASPDALTRPVDTGDAGRRARGDRGKEKKRNRRVGADTEAEKPKARAGAVSSNAGSGGKRPSRPERSGRDAKRGFDISKLAIPLVVLLIAVGVFFVVRQVWGDDSKDQLSGPGLGSPSGDSSSSTADFCGGPQPAPSDAPAKVRDWTAEIQRLYSLRAQAFEELDSELLCQVFAPTAQTLVDDVELMERYHDQGVHPEGLEFEVVDVELINEEAGRVTVEITDRMTPHTLVDGNGKVKQKVDGLEPEPWTAELIAVSDVGTTPTWHFAN